MADDWGFMIVQDGYIVAEGTGPKGGCLSKAAHCEMVYRQDGPVKVYIFEPGVDRKAARQAAEK